jgi:hypothetical protein
MVGRDREFGLAHSWVRGMVESMEVLEPQQEVGVRDVGGLAVGENQGGNVLVDGALPAGLKPEGVVKRKWGGPQPGSGRPRGSKDYKRSSPEQAAWYCAYLTNLAKKRTATRQTEVAWAQQHLEVPWPQIDKKLVPSAMAVALLKWAKENKGEFITSIYKSQLPTRKQVEQQARMEDDGSELIQLIDKLERLAKEDGG